MPVKFVFKNQVKEEKKKRIFHKFSFFLTSQKNRITRGARSNIKLSNSTPSPYPRSHDRSFVRLHRALNIDSIDDLFVSKIGIWCFPTRKKKKIFRKHRDCVSRSAQRHSLHRGRGKKMKWKKKRERKKKGGKEWTHENAYVAQKKRKKKTFLHNCTIHLRLFVRGMKHDASCIGPTVECTKLLRCVMRRK